MAVLPDNDRFGIWAALMRRGEVYSGMLKGDLRAAVDATDDWIEANQASFNTALPEPFKSNATAQQKTRLFMDVAAKKFEVV